MRPLFLSQPIIYLAFTAEVPLTRKHVLTILPLPKELERSINIPLPRAHRAHALSEL